MTAPQSSFARRIIWRVGLCLIAMQTLALLTMGLICGDALAAGLAAVVGGLLGLLVTSFSARQFQAQVDQLIRGVDRFAQGELWARLPRQQMSELADISDSLNAMAGKLLHQIDFLKAQRAEQQAIYRSMSSAVIALDLEQRIISMNRAAEHLLRVQGDSSRGRLLQEVVRDAQLNRFVSDSLAANGYVADEFTLSAAGNAEVEATSQPLRDARDQITGVLLLLHDVTQLRKLESIRSDFAANVSHELRTPITNIKGYVETMLDVGVSDQQQTRQFLDIIKRNTDRLASIVEDLMALARLEQPGTQTTLDKTSVPLRLIVDAALAQLEPERSAKATAVQVQISKDLKITANPQLLEQALGNLLTNAIRYSPGKTTVTVSAEKHDSELRIAIADQGPGIPTEHLPRIFERFYRVDRARSRSMGGTGLGLSIVKHIAIVHGGRVEVESEVGRGSVFSIVLPG